MASKTDQELDREWTQEELRAYLLARGFKPEDFSDGEIIPQGVKFTDSAPLTAEDLAWAKRLIVEHPEWNRG